MFSRIIDLENIHSVMQELNMMEQREAIHRLGWLNLFNAQNVDRCYSLDLTYEDHRVLLSVLVSVRYLISLLAKLMP